jgi:SAM-dependent methyltransferase
LFWTVPLAVYLSTFVVAFGRSTREAPRMLLLLAAAAAIPALLNIMGAVHLPVWGSVTLHLVVLAVVGLAAHSRLAAARPPASALTTFYLLVAVGGALGGLLNGFIAPVVLDRPLEYPLVLAFVPLLVLSGRLEPRDLVLQPAAWTSVVMVSGVVAVLFFGGSVIERDRTFYGSYRVTGSGENHYLYHGTTLHGWEVLRGRNAGEPTSYYTRGSPIGDVMKAYGDGPGLARVALVGVGVGTLAAYGNSGQRFDFYEIDPAVVRIARDSGHFRYLSSSAADVRVILGDGRLELSRARSSYGLIVLDAFSSDAIPAHLLTVEALEGYRRKLAPGGLLAIHISNRHLRLEPMLAAQARGLGMVAVQRHDSFPSRLGSASHWVVLARRDADIARLQDLPGWSPAKPEAGVRAWTDDYSSLVEVLNLG